MEESSALKIQYHQRENEWKKEKAILSQKLELQELQIKELKIREDNYKKFNDTILNAYNSLDQSKQNSKIFREIQMSLDSYSRELLDSKHKNSDSMIQLESQNRDLKNQLQSQQLQMSVQSTNFEHQMMALQHQFEVRAPQIDNQYEIQLNECQIQLQFERELTQRMKAQTERECQQKLNDQEITHNTTLHYFKNLYESERGELLQQLNFFQDLEKTVRIQQKPQRQGLSEISNLQQEIQDIHNKENISQQPYMSFKSSPQKSEQTVEPTSFKGFIVTAKIKQPKKQIETKIHLDTQQRLKREPQIRTFEDFQDTSQISSKKNELNNSQISNISQLNCKKSNVMEINAQQLLKSSDIFKAFGQETIQDMDQSYLFNVKNLVQQLQKEKNNIMRQISDIEDKSPSNRNERSRLLEQLKQITQELKRAKFNLQDPEDEPNLKQDIKFMVNKLLKAKESLVESQNSLNASSIYMKTRTNSKHMAKNRDLTMSHDKSLTNFTRQLNQARSIENFTQIIHLDASSQRTKRYAGSLSSYYVRRIASHSNL